MLITISNVKKCNQDLKKIQDINIFKMNARHVVLIKLIILHNLTVIT